MRAGASRVRASPALMAVGARPWTGTARRLPPNVPTGVRTGATMAALRLTVGRVVMIRSFRSVAGRGPGGRRLEVCPVAGVGDRDHRLPPPGQAQPAQVSYSIFGHDH